MRIQTVEAWKKCPKCGKVENQVKAGRNSSGSQRCKCKEYGIYYTKRHKHPEETKELAIKMYYGGSQRSRGGKNCWNEQVQCNELDKKDRSDQEN